MSGVIEGAFCLLAIANIFIALLQCATPTYYQGESAKDLPTIVAFISVLMYIPTVAIGYTLQEMDNRGLGGRWLLVGIFLAALHLAGYFTAKKNVRWRSDESITTR